MFDTARLGRTALRGGCLWAILASAAFAKSPPAPSPSEQALEQRVATLEQEVVSLTQQINQLREQIAASNRPAPAATPPSPAPPSAEQETAASSLRAESDQLLAAGKIEEAKQKLAALAQGYPNTQAERSTRSQRGELEIVGRGAPDSLQVSKWIQGEDDGKKALGAKATLLVFWEEWCPHCRREVPRLVETYARYKERGLAIVGLTRMTKSSTEESVKKFLAEQKVPYPIAQDPGALSETFHVSGIPAAAVVKGGKILWRGHPARLTPAMLESWLN